MSIVEIPSPIDLRLMRDAREWERTAMSRPYREEFFEAITKQLQNAGSPEQSILELGSGPGFLALFMLSRLPSVTLHLLDFSPAMHELAKARLAPFAERVTFVERDFKCTDWSEGLGMFDAVVTVQAVHELRHKFHADGLHRGVKGLLKAHGQYLVCDHYFGEDGMKNDQLYMSIDEQRSSLVGAGFEVSEVLVKDGRALLHAA